VRLCVVLEHSERRSECWRYPVTVVEQTLARNDNPHIRNVLAHRIVQLKRVSFAVY